MIQLLDMLATHALSDGFIFSATMARQEVFHETHQ